MTARTLRTAANSLWPSALGLLLLASVCAWMLVTAPATGGDPGPVVDVVLAVGFTLSLACLVAHLHSWAVPALVAMWGGVVIIRNLDRLYVGPLENPLGYANATAAFFVLAGAAALIVAVRASARGVRIAAVALAGVFAVMPVLNRSIAGVVLYVALAAGIMIRTRHAARLLIAAAVVTVLVVVTATVAVGLRYQPDDRTGAVERLVDGYLSERRAVLWHDALGLMLAHPVTGVGVGGFAEASPVARADPDAQWAHHEYLEMGSETGLPGFGLTVAVVLWGFAWLLSGPLDRGAAVAALALAAFAIHGAIDYVWHFPQVPLALAALVGSGAAPARWTTGRTVGSGLR